MRTTQLGLFLIAFATLTLELILIRIFDVILTPNMGYMVITCALFAFGLAGIYRAIKPLAPNQDISWNLSYCAFSFGMFSLAIRPALNWLPFDYNEFTAQPFKQIVSFLGMYFILILPFYFSGLVLTTVFSKFSAGIQSLYCWDLVGAGLGTLILIPLLPRIGPGGILFVVGTFAFAASALFAPNRHWICVISILAIIILIVPLMHYPKIYAFRLHLEKRGVKLAQQNNRIEFSRWDPISKIDVIALTNDRSSPRKHIAYDGGNQSSNSFPFDGDYQRVRREIETGQYASRISVHTHWWQWGSLTSHYLKRDQGQQVLVIGSAGGQETMTALLFGASSVDAVELVRTVIDLGKHKYAEYNGNIFNDPRVTVHHGEGRSFLRSTNRHFDIIEMFSNHHSSSIAAGTSAMDTTYLQTAEAYEEYFRHLTKDGILHINHHFYTKMITTASLAWKRMGGDDFQRHVVVFEKKTGRDNLPTLLIKMRPWKQTEIDDLFHLMRLFGVDKSEKIWEDPIHPEKSYLSQEFYSGHMSPALLKEIPYRIAASTDDRPYFNFARKHIAILTPNHQQFLNPATAGILNSQLREFIPMDVVHLFVTGGASIVFILIFICGPLLFSNIGRKQWKGKPATLSYFSCLGAGFVIIELVFIQIFMKLIGFPLYTYSTVIFTLLLAAGLGSLYSAKLRIRPDHRWTLPFLGIGITMVTLYLMYPYLFSLGLGLGTLGRIAAAFAMIFPVGFFLGMPFPLGILAVKHMPNGAIAWAWSMNSLFTGVGGLGSVLLSIYVGFNITLLIALTLYLSAFALFARMRSTTREFTSLPLAANKPEVSVSLGAIR